MDSLAWTAGALALAWLLLRAVGWAWPGVELLRLRMPRPDLAPDPAPAPLDALQQAALDELTALGYGQAQALMQDTPAGPMPACFLVQADGRSAAALSFIASPLNGFPVVFYGVGSDGRLHGTCNRLAWMQALWDPELVLHDPYAPSLEAHAAAHAQAVPDAVPVPANALLARVLESTARSFDAARSRAELIPRGRLHGLSLGAAWRALRALRARLPAVAAPYHGAVTAAAQRPALLDALHRYRSAELDRRAAEPGPRGWVFAATVAAWLVLGGAVFGWPWTLAVLGVVAVHEAGHAWAMRALGWRDVRVFMLPLIGGVATGHARDVAAWRQVLVLWAGPLPGLLAGLAAMVLWRDAPDTSMARELAWAAVAINAFNLLPLLPLDGGRLTEIGLLAGRPRLRVVFFAASSVALVALALAARSLLLGVLALVLVWTWRSQWRMAQLERRLDPARPPADQVLPLAAEVHARHPALAPTLQLQLLESALQRLTMRRPRAWERALAIVPLVLLWVAVPVVWWSWAASGGAGEADPNEPPRSVVQRQFDQAWIRHDDEPTAALRAALAEAAARLEAGDPRQVDLAVLDALDAGDERRARVGRLLAERRDGHAWPRHALLRRELGEVIQRSGTLPPAARAAALDDALRWAEAQAPDLVAPTVGARLRAAEAVHRTGDAAAARARLEALARLAESADDCACELRGVLAARAWFELDQGAPQAARALIESSPFAARARQGGEPLGVVYGEILLRLGEREAGLDVLRRAGQRRLSWIERLLLLASPGSRSEWPEPWPLLRALHERGADDEARTIVAALAPWQCRSMLAPADAEIPPWQQGRVAAEREAARALCPPG